MFVDDIQFPADLGHPLFDIADAIAERMIFCGIKSNTIITNGNPEMVIGLKLHNYL